MCLLGDLEGGDDGWQGANRGVGGRAQGGRVQRGERHRVAGCKEEGPPSPGKREGRQHRR